MLLILPPLPDQATWVNIEPEAFSIVVPPQPVTPGSDAGYRTSAGCSDPLSPEETRIVTPSTGASVLMASLMLFIADPHPLSSPAQLMDNTKSLFVVSWIAVVIASTHPCSSFGAK